MMNPQQMQQMAMQFERESTKMEMMQEMMEDTMESVLGGSEDEEEADELTQSIFDELNIEAFSKVCSCGHLTMWLCLTILHFSALTSRCTDAGRCDPNGTTEVS
eukprot:SAG31_NODE_4794_length_2953_cov_2.742467_1_plen_104_part_00